MKGNIFIHLLMLICGSLCHLSVQAQLSLHDVRVDSNISGFHFTMQVEDTRVYTPNGQADIGKVKNPSAFSLTILEHVDYEDAKEKVEELMEVSAVQDGLTQDQIVRKDTVLNGNRAYTVSMRETQKGSLYYSLVFYGVILHGHEAVLFVSGDFEKGKHIDKFRKTFYALKIKTKSGG